MALLDRHLPCLKLSGRSRRSGWHRLGRICHPPREVRTFLREQGSLTQRLQKHFGDINVTILEQRSGVPMPEEGSSSPVYIRNVVLSDANNIPLVVAHSILPMTPRGALAVMLKKLGKQALGSVLFNRPGFVRYQREWTHLTCRNSLWPMVQAVVQSEDQRSFWARRAVFIPLNKPSHWVQVTEIFVLN